MAALRFEIKGPAGTISLKTFLGAMRNCFAVLSELDSAISGKPEGTVDWIISDLRMGSLAVEVKSSPKRKHEILADFSRNIAASLVMGFDVIEREGTSPPYLSHYGINKIRNLANLIGKDGARGFTVTDFEKVANISERAAFHADQLLPVKRSVVGSIEGRLEMISIHAVPRFIVYTDLGHKAVSCKFPREQFLDVVKDSLDKRVLISGMVHLNAKGEPVSIDMGAAGLRLMGKESELPTTAELGGSDPQFTGELSTEEFIRSIRG